MTDKLIPKYMDIDYTTMKSRLITLLSQTDEFKDYNFEGANIAVLMEMVCYVGMLSTYYLNRIAKNNYMDTSDAYEPTHMLASQRGYYAQGYRSSETDLTITLLESTSVSGGDSIKIPAWKSVKCFSEKDSTGTIIEFVTIVDTTETIPTSATFPYTFTVPIKQGIVTTYNYTGADIIENKLYLPQAVLDYDTDPYDENPSIKITLNPGTTVATEWSRLGDFHSNVSGLEILNEAFLFKYNKYLNYVVEFSSSRIVPSLDDVIEITALKTVGSDGNIGAGKITVIPTGELFAYNITTKKWLSNDYITVTNLYATVGGAPPDTVEEIREAAIGTIHSQYRNVTKQDYISHLETRSDVVVANVWGEQDIAPSGSLLDYNKVYVSLIPDTFGTGTILTSASSGGVDVPYEYSTVWKTDISRFLEPRKMLSAYEEYVVPEMVYFTVDIGIKVKRTYLFANVATDVMNKLIYYFDAANRNFNETISFTDIMEYILDPPNVSELDDFDQVKGIQTLIIRNMDVVDYTIYEPNYDGNYPQYTVDNTTYIVNENKVRHIEIGHNQFPAISIDDCTFLEET